MAEIIWLCLFIVGLGVIDRTSAILRAEPMPHILQECYDDQKRTTNLTDSVGHFIQTFCIRKYLYLTKKNRQFIELTEEQLNYVRSLARESHMNFENHKRGKRQTMPIRRECRALSTQQWTDLANAIVALKRNTAVEPNLYDALAAVHTGTAIGNAHFGPNFLGWHRVYLYYYEIALRRVNPRVALCYWDSTLDFSMDSPERSVMFSSEYFGNGEGVVLEGPFREWVLPNRQTQQRLRRQINGMGSLMVYDGVREILTDPTINRTVDVSVGFTAPIRRTIEGLHNNVHTWVGEIMSGVNTAPQDPVFYFHHCYIDYFWEKYREKQSAVGINPQFDYPRNLPQSSLHRRDRNMAVFTWVRNEIGFINAFTRFFFRYADAPTCENGCSGSDHLTCDTTRNRCVSNERGPSVADTLFGSRSGNTVTFQALPQIIAEREGNLPLGQLFSSNINDIRTNFARGIVKRSVKNPDIRQKDNSTNSDLMYSEPKQKNVVHLDGDILNKPMINSFEIDGTTNKKLWNWFPVRIIHKRPNRGLYDKRLNEFQFPNADLSYITEKEGMPKLAVYNNRRHAGSGASKVYVQVNGFSYNGNYANYVFVDNRQLVEMAYTYVAIKKPQGNDTDMSYITAYDSDGRVCRPRCLSESSRHAHPQYKSCPGVISSSRDLPAMLTDTYEEAVSKFWEEGQASHPTSYNGRVFMEFICDTSTEWPW